MIVFKILAQLFAAIYSRESYGVKRSLRALATALRLLITRRGSDAIKDAQCLASVIDANMCFTLKVTNRGNIKETRIEFYRGFGKKRVEVGEPFEAMYCDSDFHVLSSISYAFAHAVGSLIGVTVKYPEPVLTERSNDDRRALADAVARGARTFQAEYDALGWWCGGSVIGPGLQEGIALGGGEFYGALGAAVSEFIESNSAARAYA